MASNTPRQLVTRALEAEVNQRLAASLLDRFGGNSSIFLQQYETARASIASHAALRRRAEAEARLGALRSAFLDKRAEYELLVSHSGRGRGALAAEAVGELCDAVEDLGEDLREAVDLLLPPSPPPSGGFRQSTDGKRGDAAVLSAAGSGAARREAPLVPGGGRGGDEEESPESAVLRWRLDLLPPVPRA
ncbi:hypothetical protein [Eptesicus fuscus gammaherpesvirus]|uniref:Tegument protein UL14 n=1 Tax=vespertilionid gammaherpesvirus 3 TaxID=2846598 RepID=A0A2D1A5M6_9GAMA|nr:hypothetical protein [Eptesicus fuscus gammaherpesvirus]ATA58264.1 hypothetical protein [Eptesicus fuscus gammaherpesvirus]WAH70926.1 UL14 [Eptesicus fuscus gammaherpesvirus]